MMICRYCKRKSGFMDVVHHAEGCPALDDTPVNWRIDEKEYIDLIEAQLAAANARAEELDLDLRKRGAEINELLCKLDEERKRAEEAEHLLETLRGLHQAQGALLEDVRAREKRLEEATEKALKYLQHIQSGRVASAGEAVYDIGIERKVYIDSLVADLQAALEGGE